ncbi:MAG: NADH-quinone oxidoreductase subunit C [Candidatus Omnitrophota bacterium]
MTKEESILQELVRRFPSMQAAAKVQRIRRIIAETDHGSFEEVLVYAIRDLGFSFLCTITGLDEGQTLGFIYHVARTDGITLSLKFSVNKDKPAIRSMIKYFPGAEIYERELMDLLGAEVEGLGEGNRYPLPDDWPKGDHPLRKDWRPAPSTVEGPKNDPGAPAEAPKT